MLTSEDVSLFWDRFTTWLFSQKVETVLLVGLLVFLATAYWRVMDENNALQEQINKMSHELIEHYRQDHKVLPNNTQTQQAQ